MVISSDIFLQEDLARLFHNKFVVVVGDSNQRSIYKDLVMLLQRNAYLSDRQLRAKGEFRYENDELIEGGKRGKMVNGVNYTEVRQYQTGTHLVRFYFVTRCYNTYMESILSDFRKDPKPDVIIMNSCLWDISRYGRNGVDEYKDNLKKLFARFRETLPDETLVIWNSTLPISKTARGGFLVPGIEFMNNTLRLDILEANFYAKQIVATSGYDLLDLHYHLRDQIHRRADDGIHWDKTAHRRISNLILTHISDAWREKRPGRVLNAVREDSEEEGAEGRDLEEVQNNPSLGQHAACVDQNGNNETIALQEGTSESESQKPEALHGRDPPLLSTPRGITNLDPRVKGASVPSLPPPSKHTQMSAGSQESQPYPVPAFLNLNVPNRHIMPDTYTYGRTAPYPSLPHYANNNVTNYFGHQLPHLQPQQMLHNHNILADSQRGFMQASSNVTWQLASANWQHANANLGWQQANTNFSWQPYAHGQLHTVNRNLHRRHLVRENPYRDNNWFGN